MFRIILKSCNLNRLDVSDRMPLFLVAIFFLTALLTGLQHSEPTIGDEVTHYYMLTNTIDNWPSPSFYSHIPNNWDSQPEIRCYPHPNGWHYIGAAFCILLGKGLKTVQIYQAILFLQLMIIVWLWIRRLARKRKDAVWISVATIGSLPAIMLFSIAFYQDVPVTAMIATSFFFLIEFRRTLLASLFMVLALWMKTSAIVFLPPFFLITLLSIWPPSNLKPVHNHANIAKRSFTALLALALVSGSLFHINYVLRKHTGANYYPFDQIIGLVDNLKSNLETKTDSPPHVTGNSIAKDEKALLQDNNNWEGSKEVIANHPGDLRIPINFLLYGGALFWIVSILGMVGFFVQRIHKNAAMEHQGKFALLLGIGLFYCIAVGWLLRTEPDARFFLPSITFFVIPLACFCTYIRNSKSIIAVLCALAVFQAAAVAFKAHRLRRISPETREAIEFLKANPVEPSRIFMYPEGNYRLFPVQHEWYMNYWLRDFWRANNDERIKALNKFAIGAIVVKKHRVAKADTEFSDLGIYPVSFVNDIKQDKRFKILFNNNDIIIFKVPDRR
jgi:hypothetical protein